MKLPISESLELRARRLLFIGGGVLGLAMGGLWLLGFVQQVDWLVYLDIPLHLAGGLVAALCFLCFVAAIHRNEGMRQIPRWLRCLAVLGFTALVTIAWEFFENLTDTYLGTELQSSVIETLKDMAVGLIGALPVATWLTADVSFADGTGVSSETPSKRG